MLTYSLLDPSGSRYFTIDDRGSTAGQIRVAPGVTLDHEDRAEVVVSVTAADLTGAYDSVDVTITIANVNEAPQTDPDSVSTPEDEQITIDVLDNDRDPEGAALTVNIVRHPVNGTVTVDDPATTGDTPAVTYTPQENYSGPDGFSYRARDTGSPPLLSAETTVTVFVGEVNDAPTFLESMPTRLVPDNAKAGDIVGAPVTATDIDEDLRLRYRLSGEDASNFVIDPFSGQLTVAGEVAFDITMTPTYTVTVTATDSSSGGKKSATVEVTITVKDVNEPPDAVDDAPDSFNEDTSLEIRVLDNDSDPEDERSELLLTVFNSGPNAPLHGTVSVNEPANAGENRTITYEPNANYNGSDTFTYQVRDSGSPPPGGPSLSGTASVSVQIDAVNDAPAYAASEVAFEVSEASEPGAEVGYALAAADVDGDTLAYSLAGSAAFEIDPVTGQITTVTYLDAIVTPTYIVTVTATDNAALTAAAEVTITVVGGEAANAAPPSPGGPGVVGGGGGAGVVGGGGGGAGVVGGGGGGGPTPSELDFEWTVTRDIDELAAGHGTPLGMWSDGATLWLLENGDAADDAIYAYDLASGERVEDREFELDETNRAPRGVWSDGSTVWVSDSGQEKLFAHDLESGERLPERDIVLADRNRAVRGIWSDSLTMWVLDGGKNSLFAYDLASGELFAEYVLDDANGDPHGIWSDSVTVWVSDHGSKRLIAYRLPARPEVPAAEDAERQELERVRDEEFKYLSKASNNSPRGLWSDGGVMYVADESDDKVYTYNMPDALDARLASLALSGVDFGEFSPLRYDYASDSIPHGNIATLTAVPAQPGASLQIKPLDQDGDLSDGYQLRLLPGREIAITVTSPDGSRERVYRLVLGQEEAAGPAPEEAAGTPASCLRGDVAVGFSLVVYAGGSTEDLVACAGGRDISALYALDGGEYISYILGAPEFVNEEFRALFADGVSALTPLTVKSDGPASADPSRGSGVLWSWPECLRGAIAPGFSLVVYEGGSVEELHGCARSLGITSLYALDGGEYRSYILDAPEFVNVVFRGLFPEGVPVATPLVAVSEGSP